MGHKKLQLNLLSQSGELINCISCFAGQVSVFRAPTYAALEVYQRALAGIPGAERVSIFLDDQPFIPLEHIFVGFGEHREGAHESVVSSFLNIGLSEEAITSLCTSYDLDIINGTPWSKLSKCEARRARLLLATRSKNQVLILNDPLEPLANQWRERFADLIATFARTSKSIVVITSLSSRPESWIDNPTIARIQVGEEIQRTIGFGAAGGKENDLVAQIRELIKDEKKVAELLGTTPVALAAREKITQPSLEKRDDDDESSRPVIAAAVGGAAISSRFGQFGQREIPHFLLNPLISGLLASTVIIAGGAYLYSHFIGSETTNPVLVDSQTEPPVSHEEVVANVQPEKLAPDTPIVEVAPVKLVRLALDEYPQSVKESILLSFQTTSRDLDRMPAEKTSENVNNRGVKSGETGDLLKLLATASDTGEGLPDSLPPSQQNDESLQIQQPNFNSEEEKREAIRKRFLEAIERAQNMRRQAEE